MKIWSSVAAVIAALLFLSGCSLLSSPDPTPTFPSLTPHGSSSDSGNRLPITSDRSPSGTSSDLRSNVSQDNMTTSVPAYLETVVRDADEQWTSWFLSLGLNEPDVGYTIVLPGQTATTTCNSGMVVTADFNNAFYCPVDRVVDGSGVVYNGHIVLPSITFQKMWNGDIFEKKSQRAGDFAAAIVVAHEFGHHVSDEISQQTGVASPMGKNNELLADCFAGNWAATVYSRGYLEDGDAEEAIAAIQVVGDFNYFSPEHHGTPNERVSALTNGFGGQPTQCLQQYWPSALR